MHFSGFSLQIFAGTLITIKLAFCALFFGMLIGLLGAVLESIPSRWWRYPATSVIFLVRGLPELLVLFFIYFGISSILSQIFQHYVNVSAFWAGVVALGLIFGAYASQVFRGAFLAVDKGQLEAGEVLGLHKRQILLRIQLPQAWRHALPGLGNLWLVLIKDTAIVTLIGLSDMMNQAKLAASTTHEPFNYYLLAALIYLVITSLSQQLLRHFNHYANRYIQPS